MSRDINKLERWKTTCEVGECVGESVPCRTGWGNVINMKRILTNSFKNNAGIFAGGTPFFGTSGGGGRITQSIYFPLF